MTHASVAGTDLEVPADLIRLSVGIETADDLVADLDRALVAEPGGGRSRSASTSAPRSPRRRSSTWPRAGSSPRRRAPRRTDRRTATSSTGTTRAWPRWSRADPRAAGAEVLACSSAGGGLRIAVVGNEELVTAEAGRRVALSSGGKVVASSRPPAVERATDLARPAARAAPDVVLLTGGTDGGNAEVLLRAARAPGGRRLDAARWSWPATSTRATRSPRSSASVPHVLADNVVPADRRARPGLGPGRDPRDVPGPRDRRQAPAARGADFTAMVRGATPGRRAHRRRAARPRPRRRHPASATSWSSTSAAPPPTCTRWSSSTPRRAPRTAWPARSSRTTPVTRTVEGDLGMRWSAVTTVGRRPRLADARRRPRPRAGTHDPASCPATDAERDEDEAIAARRGRRSRCAGTPAGRGSSSAPRAGSSSAPARTCARSTCWSARAACCATGGPASPTGCSPAASAPTSTGGWQLPRAARVVVDPDYVLAAAGLLAGAHPDAAYRLALRVRGDPGV